MVEKTEADAGLTSVQVSKTEARESEEEEVDNEEEGEMEIDNEDEQTFTSAGASFGAPEK